MDLSLHFQGDYENFMARRPQCEFHDTRDVGELCRYLCSTVDVNEYNFATPELNITLIILTRNIFRYLILPYLSIQFYLWKLIGESISILIDFLSTNYFSEFF